MSVISPIGLTFAHMYLASVQDPSYEYGFMGKISETELKNFIKEGKTGKLVRDGNSWSQEFGSNTKAAFNWDEATSTPTGKADLRVGEQGAFQYKLIQESPDKKKWSLEINVRWKINLEYSSLSRYAGSSENEIITEFIELANRALEAYWVNNNLNDVSVKLISKKPDVTVELIPRAIGVVNNEQYLVTIFPDNDRGSMGEKPEVVQLRSDGHRWFARETATFSPSGGILDELMKGNGPHEFGHMMGLPHDIVQTASYMYSGNDFSISGIQYKFGGKNTAWTSHYRIMKYWTESVMALPEVLGKKVSFIIQKVKT